MKWTPAIFSLGFFASKAFAAPVDDLDLYKLKITSPASDLDGRYISLDTSNLGIYESKDIPAVKIYTTTNPKTGLSELHTYPIGIVDHVVGLVGSDGFFTLTDITNPASATPPQGQTYQWDTFHISYGKLTNDGAGSWLAFPSADQSWSIKWSDGTVFVTQDYMPVEISLEPAGKKGGQNS